MAIKCSTALVAEPSTTLAAHGSRDPPSNVADRSTPTATTDRSMPTATTDQSTPTATTDRSMPTATTDRSTPTATTDRSTPTATADRSTPTATVITERTAMRSGGDVPGKPCSCRCLLCAVAVPHYNRRRHGTCCFRSPDLGGTGRPASPIVSSNIVSSNIVSSNDDSMSTTIHSSTGVQGPESPQALESPVVAIGTHEPNPAKHDVTAITATAITATGIAATAISATVAETGQREPPSPRYGPSGFATLPPQTHHGAAITSAPIRSCADVHRSCTDVDRSCIDVGRQGAGDATTAAAQACECCCVEESRLLSNSKWGFAGCIDYIWADAGALQRLVGLTLDWPCWIDLLD